MTKGQIRSGPCGFDLLHDGKTAQTEFCKQTSPAHQFRVEGCHVGA
jgi:hypothetical protein